MTVRLAIPFSLLVFVAWRVSPASASRHEVQIQVLSTLDQNVRGVGVGIGPAAGSPIPPGGISASTTTCPLPYPDGSHNLYRCDLPGPSGDEIGSVQNRRVKAIVTTQSGQTYYVVLGCQKQYGWCIPLTGHATYVGHLNDKPKRLEDYQHQPGQGFMKVSLRPDGKKKVTYQIEYAEKINLLKSPSAPQR